MAQTSYGTITITDITDITDIYLIYALALSTASENDIKNDTYLFNHTGERGWDSSQAATYPTWTSGYQIWVREVREYEGVVQLEYGTPYLDTAVNQLNTRIGSSETDITALQTKLKRIWINEVTNGDYVAGTYAASGINNTTFVESNPQTYGYNTLLRHNALDLRYNTVKMTSLTTAALTFYIPTQSNNQWIQGNKGLELTAEGLKLFQFQSTSTDNPTIAAELNSNGLILSQGGIKSGSVNAGNSGFIYLSTKNYGSNLTINNHQASNWRQIIGTNFGVDADGTFYASNANVSGTINATSGTIGGWTIGTSAIYNGTNSKTSTNVGTYIGTDAIRNYNTATQYIHIENGKITAKNVDLSGKITASSGQIGGWLIGTDTNKSLCYEDSRPGQTTSNLVLSTDAINQNYSIGNSEIGEHWFISAGQVFGVTTAGKVYSSSFDFGNGSSCIIFDSSDAEPTLQIMGASIFLGSSGTNISETLDSLQDVDNQLSSSVQSSNQRIDSLNESYTNFSNTITGQVSTLESNQNSMNNEIIRIDGTVESYLGENGYIYMHYDESDPYLEIGRTLKNVHFSVRLYSDIMGFYQDDEQIAYIGANQLYIKNSRITNEMRVGNFKWQPRDGRMTLMYSPLEE